MRQHQSGTGLFVDKRDQNFSRIDKSALRNAHGSDRAGYLRADRHLKRRFGMRAGDLRLHKICPLDRRCLNNRPQRCQLSNAAAVRVKKTHSIGISRRKLERNNALSRPFINNNQPKTIQFATDGGVYGHHLNHFTGDATMTARTRETAISQKPVWFITSCSTGFGRELASQLLKLDYRVVVTARRPDDVSDLAALGDALLLKLDVTKQSQIATAVNAAQTHFGQIDVLVNNAGTCYFAAIEEGEDNEVRRMFDINVFGLGQMIQAMLPQMRQRRSGMIVNISSIGGLYSFPALGCYNASKFAVEGLTEALWQEVEPFGIKAMPVEPSRFRTDWAGRSANECKMQIADYAATAGQDAPPCAPYPASRQATRRARPRPSSARWKPHTPPHRLLLGANAYEAATAKFKALGMDFSAWESVSRGADFPKGDHEMAA